MTKQKGAVEPPPSLFTRAGMLAALQSDEVINGFKPRLPQLVHEIDGDLRKTLTDLTEGIFWREPSEDDDAPVDRMVVMIDVAHYYTAQFAHSMRSGYRPRPAWRSISIDDRLMRAEVYDVRTMEDGSRCIPVVCDLPSGRARMQSSQVREVARIEIMPTMGVVPVEATPTDDIPWEYVDTTPSGVHLFARVRMTNE